MRYLAILLLAFSGLANGANANGVQGLFVEDSTIYWEPDGNWVEVQLYSAPYTAICTGRTIDRCVVPRCKQYNVVVPETGKRSENVVVPCTTPITTNLVSTPQAITATSSNPVQVCSITAGNRFKCTVSCPAAKTVSGSHCGALANGLIRPTASQTDGAGQLTCSTNGPAPVTIRSEASCF